MSWQRLSGKQRKAHQRSKSDSPSIKQKHWPAIHHTDSKWSQKPWERAIRPLFNPSPSTYTAPRRHCAKKDKEMGDYDGYGQEQQDSEHEMKLNTRFILIISLSIEWREAALDL
ncbi:hypothetical protein [Actibacterium sp. XHP0104]|uniref:hypothetical protein n=1 Tax=Actibacterium sp. XHP0104 TaxID=2984335 RepID=UPI0021E91EB2|nr:hypothetical protein [Actibacterium sp. XHP0104]MCV2880875.1 hypothetical protein [Actibacterium sp. XHP0104]